MENLKFIMMVGLPGSGKSTVALDIMKDRNDIVYVSSDDLREKLLGDVNNQDSNVDIFSKMLEITKESLNNGNHVIYDATNISRKRRKALLQQLPKTVTKVAIYVATSYKTVLEQNANRDRVVPQDVIDRMYKNLQIPIYSEGWNNILFEYDNEVIENDLPKQFTDAVRAGVLFGREGYGVLQFLAQYFNEFFDIYELAQDSKWHGFSVSRHTYYVYKHVLDNYEGGDKELMLWTALLHDIGKHFCKSFKNYKGEETRYANFIGHENVGSQIAVNLLKRMNFEDEFIHNVTTLIQFHMYLLDEKANKDKLLGRVGEIKLNQLNFLREADTQAH